MDYLIRFAQAHESFRKHELEALATQEQVRLDIVDYQPDSPFCVIRLHPRDGDQRPSAEIARSFVSRSILSRGIYELWGQGHTYDALREDVTARTAHLWHLYQHKSFRFNVDAYCGKRSTSQQREIINSFRYLGFVGTISMKDPEAEFTVFEQWEPARAFNHDMSQSAELQNNGTMKTSQPLKLYFGRDIGSSRRHLVDKHDLKRRPYISTTSMDAELALVTANFALAAPGKIFFDPFVGTGGFMVAASELGAWTIGADIDGRSFRGKGNALEKGVGANFSKYGLNMLFGDCFTSDLTNTPVRAQGSQPNTSQRWLDGIISDPPYGVREGLKVLGTRPSKFVQVEASEGTDQVSATSTQLHYIDGVLAHTRPGYIAPKKPYSFTRMLDDILNFAARTLVDGGRLAFWMPSANEAEQELALPTHPLLVLKHFSIQDFGKWSRRLLVFERLAGDVTDSIEATLNENNVKLLQAGSSADELNTFRKLYFQGFNAAQT